MDQLSDHGACPKPPMDLFAKAMGLPGKIHGNGAEVEAMYKAGEIQRIAAYCECDVLNLYGIYLRWLFVTGQMQRFGYQSGQDQLSQFLGRQQKTHHAQFLKTWDRSQNLPASAASACGSEGSVGMPISARASAFPAA
jgi:predicted PolB exonuclease-like 3'-5' exonuclease